MRAFLLVLTACAVAKAETAEQRAVAYLAREVPLWSKENHCFSCHNNGDGARALYTARRLAFAVPAQALADTTRWLSTPGAWEESRGDPGFSDKKLARLQFAAALAETTEAGGQSLLEAASLLAKDQLADGSWPIDTAAAAGSPATYGVALATYLARRTLQRAGVDRYSSAIARASRWLLSAPLNSTAAAAAVTLAAGNRRPEARELLLRSQNPDGGWGPYARAPSENFDTALALLALAPSRSPALSRGRKFLLDAQLPGGGWRATTRPSGAQSYAQHISTSAWATLALLETR